jgi:hypothetical protein
MNVIENTSTDCHAYAIVELGVVRSISRAIPENIREFVPRWSYASLVASHNEERSPLNVQPLRNPGQSFDDAIRDELMNGVFPQDACSRVSRVLGEARVVRSRVIDATRRHFAMRAAAAPFRTLRAAEAQLSSCRRLK